MASGLLPPSHQSCRTRGEAVGIDPLSLRIERARTRHGGRIGIVTAMKDSYTRLHHIATKVLSEPPFDRHPRPRLDLTFRVSADEIRAFLVMTGFAPSLIDVREVERIHPSAQAVARFAQASSFGNFLGHLPPILHGVARDAIRQRLWPFITPDGIVQRSGSLIAVAVRR